MACAHVSGVTSALRVVSQLKELAVRQHLIKSEADIQVTFIHPKMNDSVESTDFLWLEALGLS
jgi:hypothetical protein